MKKIKITQNKYVLVDDIDFDRVNQYKWQYCLKSKNACTGYAYHDFNPKHIALHRFILNAPKGYLVDHINKDGLDNRRLNLRLCNKSQNGANSNKRSNSKSKYKGIEKSNFAERWFARIRVNNERIYLGCYKTPEEAAKSYNNAAIKYFGNFSQLNII